MKIVECKKSGGTYSYNFVDENDNFVGFDDRQICCEDWGVCLTYNEDWEDSDNLDDDSVEFIEDHSDYVFDTSYKGANYGIFRLTREGSKDLFLHLYNRHNGYYAHGFEFVVDGVVITSDKL